MCSSLSIRKWLLPSRLSKCARSSSRTSLRDSCVANRSWRNSWWKCRQSMLLLSRPLTFQFHHLEGGVFKVFSQNRIQLHGVEQTVGIPVPSGGLQGSRPGQGSAASSSSRFPEVPRRLITTSSTWSKTTSGGRADGLRRSSVTVRGEPCGAGSRRVLALPNNGSHRGSGWLLRYQGATVPAVQKSVLKLPQTQSIAELWTFLLCIRDRNSSCKVRGP